MKFIYSWKIVCKLTLEFVSFWKYLKVKETNQKNTYFHLLISSTQLDLPHLQCASIRKFANIKLS